MQKSKIPFLSPLAEVILNKLNFRHKGKGSGANSLTEDDSIPVIADSDELFNDPKVNYTVTGQGRIESLFYEIIIEMEEHYLYRDKNLTIGSLAIVLHTNNTYISNAINRVGNTTFSKLINSYRISEVIRLIEEHGTSLTNKEIADKVGYRDVTTYYRQFKEIMGCTPTEYINSHRQAHQEQT
jgi:YesN/AraC family two-component response regulator